MEMERLGFNFNKLPKDVNLLTKTDKELKTELALSIEKGEEYVTKLNIEFTRLRREHHDHAEAMDIIKK